MEPIRHNPSRHLSFMSIVSVATFAAIVALVTMIATGGGRDRALEQRWYGMLASGNPAILGTFRTADLIVDQNATIGALEGSSTTLQWGGVAPGLGQRGWFQPQSSTMTTQLWMQEDDAGHVGQAGNNEAINLVLRDFTTFAMGSGGTATAGSLDINVASSKASGSGTLQTLAILSNAQGGDENYAFRSDHGDLRVADNGQFGTLNTGVFTIDPTGGAVDMSLAGNITLNQTVSNFAVTTSVTPNIAIGTTVRNDGFELQLKNTNATQQFNGIEIGLDTTVAAAQRGGVVITRGAGGGFGTDGAEIAVAGGADLCTICAAQDAVIVNYAFNKALILSANPSGANGLKLSGTSGHTVTFNTSGAPTLSVACAGGGSSSVAVGSTDTDMKITTGAGATTCVVTFAKTFTTAPACAIFPEGGLALPSCTISATAITCATVAAGTYNFHCVGLGSGAS